MRLKLQTFRIGTPRKKSEGLRLGTVRFLPRGVKKANYSKLDLFDVWLPTVAPSRELLKEFTGGRKSLVRFFRAYRAEMKQPAAKYTIQLLAALARRTPLAVGCYCENETRCHRSVLIELIRGAGGE